MRAEMTTHQRQALAAYLVTLRPGQKAWTKQACDDALAAAGNDITRDLLLLERAALAVARNPVIRTPQVIAMPGEHWESVKAPGEGVKATRCPCGDVHARNAPCRTQQASPRWRDHIVEARTALQREFEETVDVMTAEESERVKASMEAPTDPALCDCGHEGLGTGWHSNTCPAHDESARIVSADEPKEDA